MKGIECDASWATEVLRLEGWEAELELCMYVVFCVHYYALTSFKTFLAASPYWLILRDNKGLARSVPLAN